MQFDVDNMSCGHCVRAVTRAIQQLDSAAQVVVDLEHKRVDVQTHALVEAVIAALGQEGYPARLR